jgi:hypothetical protein
VDCFAGTQLAKARTDAVMRGFLSKSAVAQFQYIRGENIVWKTIGENVNRPRLVTILVDDSQHLERSILVYRGHIV